MPDPSLLEVLCKKLGHGLEEVRVRALDSILSKLDRGFLKVSDLARNKDILVKLLEWFGLEPCSRQDQVLHLILKILHDEDSKQLVAQIGSNRLLLALNKIREDLPVNLCTILDEIAALVRHDQATQSQCDDDTSGSLSTLKESVSKHSYSDKEAVPIDGDIDTSLQEALQQNSGTSSSTDQSFPCRSISSRGTAPVEAFISQDVFKHFLLPWQPLVSTDRHVLIAVEESLVCSRDHSQLLHTCNFLVDVMMRDFPGEVFLQRPTIVLTFIKLLDASMLSQDQIMAKMIIACLTTLTIALRSRILFYQDPNMANLKQEKFLISEEDTASEISEDQTLLDQDNNNELGSQVPTREAECSRASRNASVSSGSSQVPSQPCSSLQNDDNANRYNYSMNQANSDSTNTEDSVLLRLQQCSLPQFCVLAMQHVLPHVDSQPGVCTLLFQLSQLFTECVTPQLWLAPASDIVAADTATHFHEVLASFGEVLQQNRSQTLSRLNHIQLLTVVRHLLRHIVPVEIADRCIPRQLKTALCLTLLDGPLHAFFPILHADLLQYTQMFKNVHDVDSVKLFNSTLSMAESLSHAAKLLITPDPSDGSKFIRDAECALSSLSFHLNFNFIPIIFNNCSKYFRSWKLSEADRHALSTTLLKMLAHANLEIRSKTYSYLQRLVLDVLSVQCPSQPPAQALSFLLFDTAVLLEIVTHGVASQNTMVQQSAEDVLLHALKGSFLLGKQGWTQFLSSLMPTLPLLQCWADKPSAFGRAVTAMFNPDVGSEMNLGTLELLKGNLRFLFSRDESIRGEALSRLIWLLTREENAFNKVPHITDLHNCISERICLMDRSLNILQSVPETPFYQESSLLQVLEIAQGRKVEPLILSSALSQLAVMLEDPRLHVSFLSRDGLQTVVSVLHAAVSDKHFSVLPETVIPAVSALKSLCFHNTITRHKLSQDTNVFFSTLRGLMLLPSDTRLRVNASQLLALLSYSDVLISSSPRSTSDGFVVRNLSIPDLISTRMLLPFLCPTHWRTSHYTEPLTSDMLLKHDSCRIFLATAWNLSFFIDKKSPLLWAAEKPLPQEITSSLGTFSKSLQLKTTDLRVLQATAMLNTCHRQLNDIKAAATHSDVAKALSILDSILSLHKLIKTRCNDMGGNLSDVTNFEKQYKSLPWRSAFRRFLMAAPASLEDQQLLICVLQFLRTHIEVLQCLGHSGKDSKWLLNPLKQPTQPLPNLFQSVAHTGYAGDSEMPQELAHLPKWKELCKELLFLVTECVCLERNITKFSESAPKGMQDEDKENKFVSKKEKKQTKEKLFGESVPNELERADRWVDEVVSNVMEDENCLENTGWIHVIQSVVSCLKSSDSQHFYNLAYLDWLLWALVHLTGTVGWSCGLREAELKVLFMELVTVLLELIQAFHLECGKGGSSCMGLSITKAAALCLNHVLVEMQQCRQLKDWESLWDRSISKRGNMPWLSSLLQSREPVVRTAAMQLCAGIASTARGCDIVNKITSSDTWMAALCILLDHEEASMVREQAAHALTNAVENCTVGDAQTVSHFNFEILQQRLVETDFLSDLWLTIECLSLANCCKPHNFITGPAGISLKHWTLGVAPKSSVAHLPLDQHVVFNHHAQGLSQGGLRQLSCTPSLLKSICLFIDAVVSRSQETLLAMAKQHIASQLLRCIGPTPAFEFQNLKQTLLYCDTIQMYSGVCRILSRCALSDPESCRKLLLQPDTTHKILLLLNPVDFCTKNKKMQRLRDQLWTEVFRLISCLFLRTEKECLNGKENWYSAFHCTVLRSRGEPLVTAIKHALSSTVFTELQRAALACIQGVLSHPASSMGQPFAFLLDNTDIDLNSSLTNVPQINLQCSFGADLCHSLLALYDIHSLQMNSLYQQNASDVRSGWRAQRLAVIGALSSLLEVSAAAKEVAINQGFVELLYTQLSSIQSHLTMEPGETMKRLASKKKVCPILQDVELLLGLLNSTATGNRHVKQLAADVGVTDVIHKLWSWCLHHPSLLVCTLQTLATLTFDCHSACHSLALTTTVPGLGLRRTPSAQSLLHALVALVLQETELGIGSHDLTTLGVVCSVLVNSCHVPECRTILAKSNLLRLTNFLTSSTKRGKQRKLVENMWLTILLQFSAYQEGQTVIPKVPDMFDYLLQLCKGQKTNCKIALQVLRNVSFSPMNRPRLLGSAEFIQVLNRKLCDGETSEQVAAAATIWALTANNQKGKLVFKCSGTDVYILDSLRKLAVCHRPGADYVAQLLNCVLRVLRSEPSS